MVLETLTTAINISYVCHCGGVFSVYGIANISRDVAFLAQIMWMYFKQNTLVTIQTCFCSICKIFITKLAVSFSFTC